MRLRRWLISCDIKCDWQCQWWTRKSEQVFQNVVLGEGSACLAWEEEQSLRSREISMGLRTECRAGSLMQE
jgi:hypothetical protein